MELSRPKSHQAEPRLNEGFDGIEGLSYQSMVINAKLSGGRLDYRIGDQESSSTTMTLVRREEGAVTLREERTRAAVIMKIPVVMASATRDKDLTLTCLGDPIQLPFDHPFNELNDVLRQPLAIVLNSIENGLTTHRPKHRIVRTLLCVLALGCSTLGAVP